MFSNNGIPCVEELGASYEAGPVGAALGGGFSHTSKLKFTKYGEAMKTPHKPYWEDDVNTEHKKFVENCVWESREKNTVPPDVNIISSTWAMKNKSDGTHCEILNARGFDQEDGVHYTKYDVSPPVVNDIIIRIVFILK